MPFFRFVLALVALVVVTPACTILRNPDAHLPGPPSIDVGRGDGNASDANDMDAGDSTSDTGPEDSSITDDATTDDATTDGATTDGATTDGATTCVPGVECDSGMPCARATIQCVDGVATCATVGALPATTECRAAVGRCGRAEFCDGTSLTCPSDTHLPVTEVCRAAASTCDLPESCAGNQDCPPDLFRTVGATCPEGMCTIEGRCEASFCAGRAALYCTSFETTEPSAVTRTSGGGTVTLSTAQHVTGSRALQSRVTTNNSQGYVAITSPIASSATVWIRASFYVPAESFPVTDLTLITAAGDGAGSLNFGMVGNNFELWNDYAGLTLAAPGLARHSSARWECFELEVLSHATNGTIQIYRNGVLAATRSATQTGPASPDKLAFFDVGISYYERGIDNGNPVPFSEIFVDDVIVSTTRQPCPSL